MDEDLYHTKQEEEEAGYEALCNRCGACCGALDGDLCVNLVKDGLDKYYCKIYDNRFGMQVTLSGKSFRCIPIRILRGSGVSYPGCPYFK